MILFNLYRSPKTFPDMWRSSILCPIYKKRDKFVISNFRPILIIYNFCKILEILLHVTIYPSVVVLKYHHASIVSWNGVQQLPSYCRYLTYSRSFRRTVTIWYNLYRFIYSIRLHLTIIYILLRKINGFGLSYLLLQLLKTYLSNRIRYIAYNGINSVEFFVLIQISLKVLCLFPYYLISSLTT